MKGLVCVRCCALLALRHQNEPRLNFPLPSSLIAAGGNVRVKQWAQDLLHYISPNCLEASLVLMSLPCSSCGRHLAKVLAPVTQGIYSTGHTLEPLEQFVRAAGV